MGIYTKYVRLKFAFFSFENLWMNTPAPASLYNFSCPSFVGPIGKCGMAKTRIKEEKTKLVGTAS